MKIYVVFQGILNNVKGLEMLPSIKQVKKLFYFAYFCAKLKITEQHKDNLKII